MSYSLISVGACYMQLLSAVESEEERTEETSANRTMYISFNLMAAALYKVAFITHPFAHVCQLGRYALAEIRMTLPLYDRAGGAQPCCLGWK